MKYSIILEKLNISSDIDNINSNFRKYLEQVFSELFLKKLDRVFKKPLIIEKFKEKTNVMALTVGTQISVNVERFKKLPEKRAMVYIIHELFHVLQNVPQFPEIKTLNKKLMNETMKYVKKEDIERFFTGKDQNIHSDYKDEFLSYCSNFAFDFSLAPQLKDEYYKILNNTGYFNMSSDWWEERFKS